ncbi:Homeobox protein CHOX-CAD [Frankliniella fusca]|uniref:Homeobox protein CHOX-CAD n=1 Tax=Frankliniella fusca TaxID=407009 RepID=A0AAE1HZ54_9NEOP|nr:Homeobox protein CHOX-CAD [Frankliniella fusca]
MVDEERCGTAFGGRGPEVSSSPEVLLVMSLPYAGRIRLCACYRHTARVGPQNNSIAWSPDQTCLSGKTRTKDKYRVVYSDHQRLELEKEFHYSRYITIRRKAELAASLGLSERQVKIWFQNRRAKERKQTKKREELDHKVKLEDLQPQGHQGHPSHLGGHGHGHPLAHHHVLHHQMHHQMHHGHHPGSNPGSTSPLSLPLPHPGGPLGGGGGGGSLGGGPLGGGHVGHNGGHLVHHHMLNSAGSASQHPSNGGGSGGGAGGSSSSGGSGSSGSGSLSSTASNSTTSSGSASGPGPGVQHGVRRRQWQRRHHVTWRLSGPRPRRRLGGLVISPRRSPRPRRAGPGRAGASLASCLAAAYLCV